MKKSLFVAAIAAISLVACKKGEATTTATDSLENKGDSAIQNIDSTANAAIDTINKKADSATTAVEKKVDSATSKKH